MNLLPKLTTLAIALVALQIFLLFMPTYTVRPERDEEKTETYSFVQTLEVYNEISSKLNADDPRTENRNAGKNSACSEGITETMILLGAAVVLFVTGNRTKKQKSAITSIWLSSALIAFCLIINMSNLEDALDANKVSLSSASLIQMTLMILNMVVCLCGILEPSEKREEEPKKQPDRMDSFPSEKVVVHDAKKDDENHTWVCPDCGSIMRLEYRFCAICGEERPWPDHLRNRSR